MRDRVDVYCDLHQPSGYHSDYCYGGVKMSILIKGMEMPKSCYDCDLAFQDQDSEHNVYWTCAALHKSAEMYERRTDCPLIEIPPHGRLIDADKLIRNFQAMADDEWNKNCGATCSTGFLEAINMTEDAPTVIEAEEDES